MTVVAMGCDYSDTSIPARVLVAHGATFACRYASTAGNPKNLTANEVAALLPAGISIVSVFETTAMRAMDGHAAGKDDAISGRAQHRPFGLPDGMPIYFTVDFDAQDSELGAVADYFRGVREGSGSSPVGVYGSVRVCAFLAAQGLADFFWQTYAWSHGQWAPLTHLRQVQNGLVWDGHGVDLDEAHEANFGQWGNAPAPVPPPVPQPTNWTEHMITNMPEVREGATDTTAGPGSVRRIQAILSIVYGINVGASDGIFGPHTDSGVRALQQERGLAVDGIVGPHTWAALLAGETL